MKKKFLISAVLIVSMFVFSSMALAAPSASINYYGETALGGGWWQYDYRVDNTSTAGESFYSMFLDFSAEAEEVGLALPSGWDGTVWMGANTTSYLDTYSTPGNDLAAGGALSGYSFKVNYQAGSLPYTAYFDDGTGGTLTTSGVTAPEPISSILFLTGGATLIGRHYRKRKQLKSI